MQLRKLLIKMAKQVPQDLMVAIDQIHVTSLEIKQHKSKNENDCIKIIWILLVSKFKIKKINKDMVKAILSK